LIVNSLLSAEKQLINQV